MRIYGVINISSGPDEHPDGFRQDLQDRLDGAGLTGALRFGKGEELAEAMDAAKDSGADVLLVGGGDGTVRHAARAAMQVGMTLAVLPLGTLNLFARDLGMPLDWPAAVDALVQAKPIRVDTAELNGQVFLCQSSIGLVVQLAKQRERMRDQGRLSSLLGAPARVVHVIQRLRKQSVQLSFTDDKQTISTWLVAVTNNLPDEPLKLLPRRSRLDRGRLAVHWAEVNTRAGLFWLLVSYALNFMSANPHIEIREVPEVEIASAGERIEVELDGEIKTLVSPLRFRIRPGSLQVLAPSSAGAPETKAGKLA